MPPLRPISEVRAQDMVKGSVLIHGLTGGHTYQWSQYMVFGPAPIFNPEFM